MKAGPTDGDAEVARCPASGLQILLSSKRSPRRKVVAAAAVFAALAVGGCGGSVSRDTEREMTNETRPAMEQILAEYEQMEEEVFATLEAELGAKPWGRAPNDDIGPVRSGCVVSDLKGETVARAVQSFAGAYASADWDRAVEIVQRVGERHGFTELATIVHTETDVEVVGADQYGGRYVFGMAVNTVFSISTGCHVWAQAPEKGSPL